MSDEQLEQVLRELRLAYLEEAPARIAELGEQVARVERGEAGSLVELARLFHRLAGSGGSYGLDAVTSAARGGERLADDLARAAAPAAPAAAERIAELRAHVAAVAAAFAAARTEPPPQHF